MCRDYHKIGLLLLGIGVGFVLSCFCKSIFFRILLGLIFAGAGYVPALRR